MCENAVLPKKGLGRTMGSTVSAVPKRRNVQNDVLENTYSVSVVFAKLKNVRVVPRRRTVRIDVLENT